MSHASPLTRRRLLVLLGASATGGLGLHSAIAEAADDSIASIEKVVLRRGRDGSGPTWFHPRACVIPGKETPRVFMTLQTIAGSDYFGPVHWMESGDLGQTWTDPQPVPGLGRIPAAGGMQEGVCDVVPEYHPQTRSVLAVGHNVFYKAGRLHRPQPRRWPVYTVWRDGQWSVKQKLEWDDPRGTLIYTNGCGQRVVLPNGDVLLMLSCAAGEGPRSVLGALCAFDGRTLSIRKTGPEIRHAAGRGMLESSLIRHRGKFYVTLRAEDNRGYVAASDNGLDWAEKQPWCWDSGEPLEMSTTQQHWLAHGDTLYLVYTRKDALNLNVPRWRAQLFMAQVDTRRLRLLKATERIVLPIVGDGVNNPDEVAMTGNFHTVSVSDREAWVTDGEVLPKRGYRGDLLLARIRWK